MFKINIMKTTVRFSGVFILFFILISLTSQRVISQTQDYYITGMPGDNFNLYAVLNIFKDSRNLEEFERRINYRGEYINNLDLNYDGRIDYVQVYDYRLGFTHNIILKVDLNRRVSQEVAIIQVERGVRGEVVIRIIGNEYLYGNDYVIEPNPDYRREAIIYWPIFQLLFADRYEPWISPWRWGYYPDYWRSWNPFLTDRYIQVHHNNLDFYRIYFKMRNGHDRPKDNYNPRRDRFNEKDRQQNNGSVYRREVPRKTENIERESVSRNSPRSRGEDPDKVVEPRSKPEKSSPKKVIQSKESQTKEKSSEKPKSQYRRETR